MFRGAGEGGADGGHHAWRTISRLHTYQPNGMYLTMSRPTKLHPERGDARTRLLEAARDVIRAKGFAATSVDDLCEAAAVTKGSFFHHFASKEALGVAAADYWTETTGAFFADAPYHRPADPLDRVLEYVAFRKSIISGELSQFSCLVGTMVQDVYASSPAIRDACARSIFGHAEALEDDIADAMTERGITGWSADSLARHTQAVLQGAFILAKAGNDPALAREALDHLDHYIRLLFAAEPALQ
jgi:TetR/AcrR family transcriptional repressor of nem operon